MLAYCLPVFAILLPLPNAFSAPLPVRSRPSPHPIRALFMLNNFSAHAPCALRLWRALLLIPSPAYAALFTAASARRARARSLTWTIPRLCAPLRLLTTLTRGLKVRVCDICFELQSVRSLAASDNVSLQMQCAVTLRDMLQKSACLSLPSTMVYAVEC